MDEATIKRAVKKRDGHKCVDCGSEHDLHVHRLVPGSPYTMEGCVTLCIDCHDARHSRVWENREFTEEDVVDLLQGGKLTCCDVALYAVLARYADDQGELFQTHYLLAERMGATTRSVMRHLHRLQEVSVVQIEKRLYGKVYLLNPERVGHDATHFWFR